MHIRIVIYYIRIRVNVSARDIKKARRDSKL